MRNKRVDVEEVENGYTIRCFNCEEKDEKGHDGFYEEPVVHVATKLDEVLEIIKKNLK